jgi:hypothetical protein
MDTWTLSAWTPCNALSISQCMYTQYTPLGVSITQKVLGMHPSALMGSGSHALTQHV